MTCLCLAFAAPVAAQTLEKEAQAIFGAYPDSIAAYDGAFLIWKDGSKVRFGDAREDKPLDELLDKPDIADMFRWTYPFGAGGAPAARDADPGRVRNEAFFAKYTANAAKSRPMAAPVSPAPRRNVSSACRACRSLAAGHAFRPLHRRAAKRASWLATLKPWVRSSCATLRQMAGATYRAASRGQPG